MRVALWIASLGTFCCATFADRVARPATGGNDQAIVAALVAAAFSHPILAADQVRTLKSEARVLLLAQTPAQTSEPPKIISQQSQRIVELKGLKLDFRQYSDGEIERHKDIAFEANIARDLIPKTLPEEIDLVIEPLKDNQELELRLRTARIPDRILKITWKKGVVTLAIMGEFAKSLELVTRVQVKTGPTGRQQIHIQVPASAFAYSGSIVRAADNKIRLTAATPFSIAGVLWLENAGTSSEKAELRRVQVTEQRASVGAPKSPFEIPNTMVDIPLTEQLLQIAGDSRADEIELQIASDGSPWYEFLMLFPDGGKDAARCEIQDEWVVFDQVPRGRIGAMWVDNIFTDIITFKGRLSATKAWTILLAPQRIMPGSHLRLRADKPPTFIVVTRKAVILPPQTPPPAPGRRPAALLADAAFSYPMSAADPIRAVKSEAHRWGISQPAHQERPSHPGFQSQEDKVQLRRVKLEFQKQPGSGGKIEYQATVARGLLPNAFPETIDFVLETDTDFRELEFRLQTPMLSDRILKIRFENSGPKFDTGGYFAKSLGSITRVHINPISAGRQRVQIQFPASVLSNSDSTGRDGDSTVRFSAAKPFSVEGAVSLIDPDIEPQTTDTRTVDISTKRLSVGCLGRGCQPGDLRTAVEIPLTEEFLQVSNLSRADELELEIASDGALWYEFTVVYPDGGKDFIRCEIQDHRWVIFAEPPPGRSGVFGAPNIFTDVISYTGHLQPNYQTKILIDLKRFVPGSRLIISSSKFLVASATTRKAIAHPRSSSEPIPTPRQKALLSAA
jgi:hypothetical protein